MLIEVQCPCCDHLLQIDTTTHKVVSHQKKKPKIDLGAFMREQEGKSEELDRKFAEQKQAQANKMAQLSERFEQNRKKGHEQMPDLPQKFWD